MVSVPHVNSEDRIMLERDEGKLKVGLVGFGKMGMLHAGILNFLPEVKLAAICEKSGLIRKFLKKVFKDVKILDEVDRLSSFDLDAVYVTTPIGSHFPVVKSLYENGVTRNLFVEKTLASNFDEARKLCEFAQEFGGVNMTGYMRRFCVTFMKAKGLLSERVIGKPLSFKAYAYSSDFFGIDGCSKVKTPVVGVLRDLGCHALDLALWFFGDLKVTDVRLKSVLNNSSIDSAYLRVEASSGLVGEFSVSWCVSGYRIPEVGFVIEGSEGCLTVNDDKLELNMKDGSTHRWFRHDLDDRVDFWLGSPEYYREDECFVEAVVHGRSVEPSFEAAAKVDGLIDEVLAGAGQLG